MPTPGEGPASRILQEGIQFETNSERSENVKSTVSFPFFVMVTSRDDSYGRSTIGGVPDPARDGFVVTPSCHILSV